MTENSNPPRRTLSCWIEGFLDLTQHLQLADSLRLWAGITALSGLLERRVWTTTVRGPLYPNLFVLLVTPPGIGKTLIIDPVTDIWRQTDQLHVAPDNMSKAAFLDVLQDSGRMIKVPGELEMLNYHALNISASEFGVLCPAHDMEYLSVLTSIYDCRPNFRDNKRSRDKNQIDIRNPHINLLAGTQPDYLAQFLPDVAWGQGFMARVILVYDDSVLDFDMFGEHVKLDKNLKAKLNEDAKAILEIVGNIAWTQEAQDQFRSWATGGYQPVPAHLKLKHYNVRRGFYALKLALISAVSYGHKEIQKKDIMRAITWLTDVEAKMPEIFKAMKGNSDYGLLQELQLFVTQVFISGGKPLAESRLVRFLAERTASWNIPKIIEAAEKSGLIQKKLGPNGFEVWTPGDGQLGPET